ncbi:hypothetical protein [Microbulbifer agarilyticus]|uniref:hypothetical protein n=1 Tax=Microbulbifer agarilyticus TaxID=260552 RepID=UPI0012FBCDE1|nr:hypothetical protein [Microbulbifer agarilyticus]
MSEKKPLTNTRESKIAHGYVEGYASEILVGDVLLKIPPDVNYTPESNGRVVPGKADQITFGLRYPDIEPEDSVNLVVIKVRRGFEDPGFSRNRIDRETWVDIKDLNDLGLTEYRKNTKSTAHGYVMYTPVEGVVRTPKGGPIIYSCQGNYLRVVSCYTGFELQDGLYVEYIFPYALIENWRKIQVDVQKFVAEMGGM